MSKCPGLHCPGCGEGGGCSVGFAVLVLVVAAAVHAAWHTVIAIWRAVVTALEIAAYTLVSLAGLAVVAGLVYGGYRVNRALRRRAAARPLRVVSVRPVADKVVSGEIEAPRTVPPGWPDSWPILTDEEIRQAKDEIRHWRGAR